MPAMPPPGRAEREKPKKGPSLVIAVGVPKGTGMPPPGTRSSPEAASEPEDGGQKASPEEALVIRDDKHCKDCAHWTPQSGECMQVEGQFYPDDACLRYFEPLGAEEEEEPGGEPMEGPEEEAQEAQRGRV